MSAVQRIVVDPLVTALLADMRLAPPQFVETFLEQEELQGLSSSFLSSLDETELELLAMRWSAHATGTANPSPVRYLPSRHLDTASVSTRPHHLDEASVAEMMRGMFHE